MDMKRLDWILMKAQDAALTPWEETFIADMTARRERLGDRLTVSDNQEAVLERIAAK